MNAAIHLSNMQHAKLKKPSVEHAIAAQLSVVLVNVQVLAQTKYDGEIISRKSS